MADISAEDNRTKQLEEMISSIYSHWKTPQRLSELIHEWETYGPGVNTMVEDIVAERTRAQWASLAESRESTTVDDLVNLLWEPFTEGEFTMEKTEDGIQIYCTFCPIADVFKEIGKEEYGFILFCAADPYIVEGFNPALKFRRTKTLMDGDDCCDHYYCVKE
jgi:predicted ArsR family transcriptional regulator